MKRLHKSVVFLRFFILALLVEYIGMTGYELTLFTHAIHHALYAFLADYKVHKVLASLFPQPLLLLCLLLELVHVNLAFLKQVFFYEILGIAHR